MLTWTQGIVLENFHCSDQLFALTVDAGVDRFIAGQFTSLALDINGERIVRPYSYKNSPDESELEFYISTIPEGMLSNALAHLKAGDTLWIRREANGFFILDEVPVSEDLWMLATGTGIAPYLSILKTKQPWQNFGHIILVYAVRRAADLHYRDDIETLQQQYKDQLSIAIFVSREVAKNTLTGRIPQAIADNLLEDHVSKRLSPSSSQIMLCGNPGMVKDTTALLKSRGFKVHRRRAPGQITYEKYW